MQAYYSSNRSARERGNDRLGVVVLDTSNGTSVVPNEPVLRESHGPE
jgi:hypothetical protein